MTTIRFHHKLVRDRIPEICRENGAVPDFRVITNSSEYLDELTEKLLEEAQEVKDLPSLEELADAQEVINAIAAALGYTKEELEAKRAQKFEERGGFESRILLISTEE